MLVTSTGSLAFSNNKLAYAEETGTAGICTPKDITLGDSVSSSTADTGVATYVGRDMYIGANLSNSSTLTNNNGPDGSYAVEAEGLTVVNGKLAMNPLNDSWRTVDGSNKRYSAGFRFGTVGFGGQFRPKSGAALVVGGQKSGITNMSTGNVNDATVGAWTKGGWTGQSYDTTTKKPSDASPAYTAQIAGTMGQWQSNPNHDAIVGQQNNWKKDSGSDNRSYDNAMKVTGTNDDNSRYTTDYSDYANTIQSWSESLAAEEGTAATVNAYSAKTSLDGVWRGKYNWDVSTSWASYGFKFNNGQSEKVITFNGDGASSMQYFTLPASELSGDKNISFEFTNIPDTASVVINVTGANNGTISFHNGWRVWWNGTDVSDGYRTKANTDIKKAYSHAAEAVMWNFVDASTVKILGGRGTGTLEVTNVQKVDVNEHNATDNGRYSNVTTTDDPAAAFLGSIMVPNGSLESHVSTNGRVWVGQDFSMYNPESATINVNGGKLTTSEGKTASVINMDQERHNLPWSGAVSSECSTITWNKTDSETGNKVTSASGWAVYATLDAAKGADTSKLLLAVTDNAGSDLDSAMGTITIGRLNPNADYFIKEISAPDGYREPDRTNPTIYKIHTTNKGDTANANVYKVWENGQTVSDTLMSGSNIPNKKSGAELSWQKRAGGENGDLLAGSVWTLIKKGESGTADESWDVHDNTATVSGVKIKQNGTEVTGAIDLQQHNYVDLTAVVLSDSGATPVQNVTWTTSNASVATVSNGRVAGIGAGSAIIKACSVSDSTKCATVTVNVTAVAVNSLTVKSGSTELRNNGALTLQVNGSTALDTTVDPSTVQYSITSADTSIVSVSNNVLTGLKADSTTVTITAGNKSIKLKVTVQAAENPNDYTYVYFHHTENGWTGNIELHYQKNDGSWTNPTDRPQLTKASCNSDYVYVKISKADNGKQFGFKIVGNTSSWYGKNGGGNFTFNGGNVVTVAGGNQLYDYPSGCSATKPTSLFSNNAQATVKTARYVTGDSSVTLADVADTNGDATGKTAPTTLTDVDTAVGQFKILNLEDGTYWLTEKTAPDGYTLNKRVYKVTITNGVVGWQGSWPSTEDASNGTNFAADDKPFGAGNAISDKPTEVKWYKVDSKDTYKQLTGAQWQLIWTDSTGSTASTTYCVVDGNGDVKVNTCTGEKLTDVSKTGSDGTVANEADGVIALKGLKFGTYTLTETVAPDGYDLSDKTYTFTIDQNSTAGAVQISVTTTSGKPTEVTGNKIPNTPGVELPATGGIGTALFLVGGTLTVMVALAGLTISVRRWRR